MANYWQNQQAANNTQSLGQTNKYNNDVSQAQNTVGGQWGGAAGSANYNQQVAENATAGVTAGQDQNNLYYNNQALGTYNPTQNGYSTIAQGGNYQTGDNSPYTQNQLADVNGLMGLATWGSQQAGNFVPGGSAAGNSQYNSELNSGIYNNPNLGLSQQFTQNYKMTPEEIQGLANQAGRTVGNQFQTEMDTANRNAAAAGMSAMGTNALQNRVAAQSAGQSGDAMANARLNAQLAALGVTQQAEAMRLGAAQTQASDIMNAANSQAALGLSGAEAGAQFGANMGEYVDSNLANRLTGLATGQQQYGLQQIASEMGQQGQQFNQGLAGNQTLSGQQATQAGLGLGQENISTQQLLQLLAAQNSGNITQGQLQNSGTQLAAQLQQPGIGQQILGAVLGGIQAVGGGAGMAKLATI